MKVIWVVAEAKRKLNILPKDVYVIELYKEILSETEKEPKVPFYIFKKDAKIHFDEEVMELYNEVVTVIKEEQLDDGGESDAEEEELGQSIGIFDVQVSIDRLISFGIFMRLHAAF